MRSRRAIVAASSWDTDRPSSRTSAASWCWLPALVALAGACHGPCARRGRRQESALPDRGANGAPAALDGISRCAGSNALVARAHYGIPVLQKAVFWDGNGEEDNYGLGIYGLRFVDDGLALGLGSNATVWMQQPGHDVYSLDAEAILRWYPSAEARPFAEFGGGGVYATDRVPAGGTQFNYTFHWGLGYDFPLSEGTSLLVGAQFHHVSNAQGRQNERNPSQNEVRLWIGYAFTF